MEIISYQYTYLFWTAIFLIIWGTFFIKRKDLRKEMLVISFLFGLGGLISELTHIQDWWQPLTITNTSIGIEDFLIGFAIGGIASVIYNFIFNKKIKIRKNIEEMKISYLLIAFPILFLTSFYLLNLHSFYACIIAFIPLTAIIYYQRKDLIKDSLISGAILLTLGIVIYTILRIFSPGFMEEFWYFPDHWFSTPILGIPLAEYIWFFLAGAFIGPLYEYWQEAKLINIKNK